MPAERLLELCHQARRTGQRPVFGLNGPVGAGKTTLAAQLQQQLAAAGVQLAVASIDDAYLPWPQRLQQLQGNPFGVTRVPPGSHEPALLSAAIDHWRADPAGLLELPRFDKRLRNGDGDRTEPWRGCADALLLEGWLVGCRPVSQQQLQRWYEPEPTQKAWLQRCNQALEIYEPLWDRLDLLLLLWPISWQLPRRWRFQAEARQRRRGGGWMSAAALDALVQASLKSLPPQLYQRPLLQRADWVRVLDRRRQPHWQGSGGAALRWLDQS